MLSKRFIINWIILFFGVIIFVFIIARVLQMSMADYFYQGLPLKFYEGGGMCVIPRGPCPSIFHPINLMIDILIWILISFGLAYWIEKKTHK